MCLAGTDSEPDFAAAIATTVLNGKILKQIPRTTIPLLEVLEMGVAAAIR